MIPLPKTKVRVPGSTTVSIDNTDRSTLSVNYDDILDKLVEKFNKVPTIEYKCHNCGGTLEMKADEYIFKCPYCKSCYAVGTNQINYRYK